MPLQLSERIDLQKYNYLEKVYHPRMGIVVEINEYYIRCKADAGYFESLTADKGRIPELDNPPLKLYTKNTLNIDLS